MLANFCMLHSLYLCFITVLFVLRTYPAIFSLCFRLMLVHFQNESNTFKVNEREIFHLNCFVYRSMACTAQLISTSIRRCPWLRLPLWEGLNGVNRQPSNGPKINRQPLKKEYFYRQPSNEQAKISRQISKITIETDWVQVMLLIIVRFNISQRYIFVLVSLE